MQANFDFHVHSLYSDGTGSPAIMAEAAEARGLHGVAITDHGPELSVGIKRERITQAIEEMRSAKEEAGIPLLVGFEANVVNQNGDLDIEESITRQLDILVVGVHYLGKVFGPREMAREYLRRATEALVKNRCDVLAHPFFLHRSLTPYLHREDIEDFVELAAGRGVAMEVNEKYRAPEVDFLQLCLRKGVKLSVGSDAHTPAEVGRLDWTLSALKKAGAGQEDFVLKKFL
jgi:putative hydrolase